MHSSTASLLFLFLPRTHPHDLSSSPPAQPPSSTPHLTSLHIPPQKELERQENYPNLVEPHRLKGLTVRVGCRGGWRWCFFRFGVCWSWQWQLLLLFALKIIQGLRTASATVAVEST